MSSAITMSCPNGGLVISQDTNAPGSFQAGTSSNSKVEDFDSAVRPWGSPDAVTRETESLVKSMRVVRGRLTSLDMSQDHDRKASEAQRGSARLYYGLAQERDRDLTDSRNHIKKTMSALKAQSQARSTM